MLRACAERYRPRARNQASGAECEAAWSKPASRLLDPAAGGVRGCLVQISKPLRWTY